MKRYLKLAINTIFKSTFWAKQLFQATLVPQCQWVSVSCLIDLQVLVSVCTTGRYSPKNCRRGCTGLILNSVQPPILVAFYSKAAAWERESRVCSEEAGLGVLISWISKQRTIVKLEELFRIHVSIILMKSGEERGGYAHSNGHCQDPPQPLSIPAGRKKVCGWVCRRNQHGPTTQALCVCVCVCITNFFPYRKHVIALHVSGVFVLALVVKLPEEVEGQNSVEIDDNSQQPHGQDQLKRY